MGGIRLWSSSFVPFSQSQVTLDQVITSPHRLRNPGFTRDRPSPFQESIYIYATAADPSLHECMQQYEVNY